MGGDKLACKLGRQALPIVVGLVERLEECQLRWLKGFLVDDWLDTPGEVLVLIFTVCSHYHISGLEELHMGVYQACVYVVRVAL